MKDFLLAGMLLAQQDPLDSFAREFQGRETRLNAGYLTVGLVILLVILLAVWILSKVLEGFEGRRPVDNSLMLFVSLCRAHGLRWSESWLLWRVARTEGLSEPARLFLEPRRLDPANVSPALRLGGPQLAALARRLFAGIPADEIEVLTSAHREGETPSQHAEAGGGASPVAPIGPRRSSDSPEWPLPTSPSGDLPPATSK